MAMKYYRTAVLQDAYIRHSGVVCGEDMTPEDASEAGIDAWKGRRRDIKLIEDYVVDSFDHAEPIDPEEVEEITKEEYEEELAEVNAARPTGSKPA